MKKIVSLLAVLMLLTSLVFGCAPAASTVNTADTGANAEEIELIVFAAASMTESLNRIAELYALSAPNVKIIYNFDSSGTLKTQIQEGADCDVFISAGQKQMNQLDITADAAVNTDGLDFVLAGSRFNILSNSVVLVVPEGSDKGIASFDDIMTDKVSLIALGNSDVPAGQYAEEIFTNLGVWEALNSSGKISFGTNVKEVLAQVEAASVDCGIVYSTDAASATGVTVAASAPDGSHKPIVYPAAIIKNTKHQAEAEAFLKYLESDAATAVFASVGFTKPAA